jgi:hypothetical protein
MGSACRPAAFDGRAAWRRLAPRRPTVASRYDGRVTTPTDEPGDRRPGGAERTRLEHPPGDRYAATTPPADAGSERLDAVLVPVGIVLGTAITFVVAGGIVTVTAGLIVLAAFLGWLTGHLVSPPGRAAIVALVAIVAGFLGIWLFGRIEGGVLDPITYLLEVEGPFIVVLSLVGAGGLAAAASR